MSKTDLTSSEIFKIIWQGALGGLTFGAYHQYTTNKMMELNNEKVEIQHKYFMDKMENNYKSLNERTEKLVETLEKLEKVVSQQKS
jgi:hypothetical protein